MATALRSSPEIPTLAALLYRLGDIAPERVRFYPIPGQAVEADVAEIEAREDRLCELMDGVLVEKPMGYRESLLAGAILAALRAFVLPRKLGRVTGEGGMVRLAPGIVRIPDVAFVSRQRLEHVPDAPVAGVAPDLVVEVLSPGNTEAEMARKRREYFQSGVRLVWEIDPETRQAAVYTEPESSATLDATQTLDGGEVLPGFTLSLAAVFAELDD